MGCFICEVIFIVVYKNKDFVFRNEVVLVNLTLVQYKILLALIVVEILFIFSLKMKRLQRKAGKWFIEIPEPFASKSKNIMLLYSPIVRKPHRYLFLGCDELLLQFLIFVIL